jgi:DNA-binding CsgD family transcriptional regulator
VVVLHTRAILKSQQVCSCAWRGAKFENIESGKRPAATLRSDLLKMKTGQTPDVGHSASAEARAGMLRVCIAALNAVRSPLCIVAPTGRTVLANRAGEAVLSTGRWIRLQHGCVVSTQPHTGDTSLPLALQRLADGLESTVLLSDRNAAQQAIVSVAPVSRDSSPRKPDSRPTLGLLWLATTEPYAASVKQVGRLFCLTRAEQTLLAQLVTGKELRGAAEELNVSIHTARNQLKAILRKTGRHTQAQLLTLVNRVSSLQIEPPD